VVCPITLDDPDAYREFESPRAGTAGIEQQLAVDHFVARLMTVPEDDDVGIVRQQLFAKDVREQNAADDLRLVAGGVVIVSTDEFHWRDRAQCFQNVIAANVAGVKDQIDAPQRFERLGADQSVRVGDDADSFNSRLRPSSPRPNSDIGL